MCDESNSCVMQAGCRKELSTLLFISPFPDSSQSGGVGARERSSELRNNWAPMTSGVDLILDLLTRKVRRVAFSVRARAFSDHLAKNVTYVHEPMSLSKAKWLTTPAIPR